MPETSFSVGPLEDLEVIRSIGRGHVAEVFLARERALGRLVALKVVHPEVAADPIGRERFEREGFAAARIPKEGVVQVHWMGETADRRPFLVMEYIKGRNLEERLAAEGPLPLREVRRILIALAQALDAVHAHDVVHRDVRPANVLEEEETGRIVLTDFGLARLLESGSGDSAQLTKTGQLLGDLRFITPEQLRGDKTTTRADIYQLGVIAHYLATGQGPFGEQSTSGLIAGHREREPADLVAPGGDRDPELAALVRRCLAKEPARRPNAADIVRRLSERDTDPQVPGVDLIRRRVPHFVLPTIGLAVVFLGTISDVIQNAGLRRAYYGVAVTLSVAAVLASAVLSWFHGARGKQRVEPLEIALLGALGLIFVAVSWVLLT